MGKHLSVPYFLFGLNLRFFFFWFKRFYHKLCIDVRSSWKRHLHIFLCSSSLHRFQNYCGASLLSSWSLPSESNGSFKVILKCMVKNWFVVEVFATDSFSFSWCCWNYSGHDWDKGYYEFKMLKLNLITTLEAAALQVHGEKRTGSSTFHKGFFRMPGIKCWWQLGEIWNFD